MTIIEKLPFHLAHVRTLDSTECGKTRNYFFRENSPKEFKVKKGLFRKSSEVTGKEIQSQNWGGNRKLSIEGIAVEYFPTSVDIGKNEENMNSIPI